MSKSTRTPRRGKSTKPHPASPFFRHATGRWCNKVRGKSCYSGKLADGSDG